MSAISILATIASVLALPCADAQVIDSLDGDLGGAVYYTGAVVRGLRARSELLPYAYADYARFFARADTFGIRTLPVGYGHLEFAARVSQEGFKADSPALNGIHNRSDPWPIGIGSFQETPYGGVFLYAFADPTSRGSLIEATYAAKFMIGSVDLYPEIGVERRSARYVRHLYGVSTGESQSSGLTAYSPNASMWPVLSLTAEVPLLRSYSLVLQGRRKWFDHAVRNSPLVEARGQNSAFIALAYQFHAP